MGRRVGALTVAALLGLGLPPSGTAATREPGAVLSAAVATQETARLAYSEIPPRVEVIIGSFEAGNVSGAIVPAAYVPQWPADVYSVLAESGTDASLLARTVDGEREMDDSGPTFSPDGERVVLSSEFLDEDDVLASRLVVGSVDGAPPQALDYARERFDRDTAPVWSPDGTQIAFVRTRDRLARIWVAEIGPDLKVSRTFDASRDPSPVGGSARVDHLNPSWGPDSRHLVLEEQYSETTRVSILDVATGDVQPLSVDSCSTTLLAVADCRVRGSHPAWSPDGGTLAIADYSSRSEDIALIALPPIDDLPAEGPVVIELGAVSILESPTVPIAGKENEPSVTRMAMPAWSPDGREIAFAGVGRGWTDYDVFAMAPDSSGLRKVAGGQGDQFEPAYQPWARQASVSVQVGVAANGVAWVGGVPVVATITVSNAGPQTAEGVELTTAYPAFVDPSGESPCLEDGGTCELGTLAPGDSMVLQASLDPLEQGTGDVTASVVTATQEEDASDNEAAATVMVEQPRLEVQPTVVRPGDVLVATGDEFPPGSGVSLAWSRGFTPLPGLVTVDGAGRWQVSILVARWDVLGERVLRATSTAEPAAFGPVERVVTVVPAPMDAPRFLRR